MFVPNTTALLHRMTGRSPFGRPTFDAPVSIRIGIVDLGDTVTPSAVRADQSASRGSADIDTAQATILLPKTQTVKDGDVIEIDGLKIQISGVMPRRNVLGQIDHWEVTGRMQAGEV